MGRVLQVFREKASGYAVFALVMAILFGPMFLPRGAAPERTPPGEPRVHPDADLAVIARARAVREIDTRTGSLASSGLLGGYTGVPSPCFLSGVFSTSDPNPAIAARARLRTARCDFSRDLIEETAEAFDWIIALGEVPEGLWFFHLRAAEATEETFSRVGLFMSEAHCEWVQREALRVDYLVSRCTAWDPQRW
ncbi:hypothetical protein J2T57_001440 [Natronocella acetinitrilica]|uniref:Uncharacterized protein n=1 Tax=Natronocella acetinitrilica TaxID=414046 RepID=A0AAE3G4P0_9GAMM|nr:hypothetical protein [Natronocella acetinitrilica]MCP1674338.1 hypothetical protein [Natronocella acetinitrilica]